MRKSIGLRVTVAALLLASTPAWAGSVQWGGVVPTNRTQNFRLLVGSVLNFEGAVEETTRKLYDVNGRSFSQADAESFNTSDFDMEGPYGGIGFSLDMAWKYFRMSIDSLFMAPSISTTAKRDYYLTVGEDIDYNGGSYDHLMIPEGTPFTADIFGNMTEINFSLVPIGFQLGESVVINPSFDFGLLLFLGTYDIDAGETTGVTPYQNPPEDFAVGGSSGGFIGMGAPQWGPGVNVRLGRPGGVNLDLRARYLFFTYNGSTSFLTTADHRDKDLDFDHSNVSLRAQVEFPMKRIAWNIGIQAQFIDSEGTIESKSTDPDEILANRERFDKEFSFRMESILATIGITF